MFRPDHFALLNYMAIELVLRMNLRDLLKIDLDGLNATNRELWLELLTMILRVVAVLVILFAIVRTWRGLAEHSLYLF